MGTNAGELPAERCSGVDRARKNLIGSGANLLFLLFILLAPKAVDQQASDCLLCHGSSTGLKNSQGKDITVGPAHMKGPHATCGGVEGHAGASAQNHHAKTAA